MDESRLKRLWAPWRLAYVTGEPTDEPVETEESPQLPAGADEACFLCRGAASEDERGHWVVRRTAASVTVLNRFPYNNGHLLVAPRRHEGQFEQLTSAEHAELVGEIARWLTLLRAEMNADGFNVGLNLGAAAGAGLPGHLHWHIVPRWNGDTNFMPTLAGTRVIPQSLEALWQILRECDEAGK